MPTQAPPRRPRPTYQNQYASGNYHRYSGYSQSAQSTARAYDYPVTYPDWITPIPHKKEQVQASPKTAGKGIQIKREGLLKTLAKILLVGGLCMLMLYRYAAILECSNQIDKLEAEISALSARNQSLQAKIDRGLEMSALEEYATGRLGMVRPDNAQMFYIDMQLSDAAAKEDKGIQEEKGNALQGAPGALVHALQVLN